MTIKWTKKALFSNPTQYARRQYGTVTIPFKRGEWFGDNTNVFLSEDGVISNVPIHVRPFGTKYADGSCMQGELAVPLSMGAWSEKTVTIKEGDLPVVKTPFNFGADLLPKLGSLKIKVGVTNDNITWNIFNADSSFKIVEENLARIVMEYRKFIGDFLVILNLYVYQGQDLVEYDLQIFGSNPGKTTVNFPFEEIRFAIEGAYFDVLGAARKNVMPALENKISEGQELILLKRDPAKEDGYMGDGQGVTWIGNIYFQGSNDEEELYGATISPLWGLSLDLDEVGTFGLVKTITKPLTDANTTWEYLRNKYEAYEEYLNTRGYVWDDCFIGMTKHPSQTGNQDDIVVTRLLDVVGTKRPEMLKHYVFFATKESMRDHHYFEEDGTHVKALNHPDWVTWAQTTFDRTSVDLLGKTRDQFKLTHDWSCHDDEHFCMNTLVETAYLVPRYALVREIQSDEECYIAGHTLPSQRPGWSTNFLGPARAIGRTNQSFAKGALVTGNMQLIDRLVARFDECIADQWVGKTSSPRRPLLVNWPDGRVMLYRFTNCWQELLAPIGLEMLTRLTEYVYEQPATRIRDLSQIVCANTMKDGWKLVRDTEGKLIDFKIGHGLRWWEDERMGQGITPEQYFDQSRTYFVPADYLELWTIPALEMCQNQYLNDAEATARAKEISDLYISGRQYVPFDIFSYWQGL